MFVIEREESLVIFFIGFFHRFFFLDDEICFDCKLFNPKLCFLSYL